MIQNLNAFHTNLFHFGLLNHAGWCFVCWNFSSDMYFVGRIALILCWCIFEVASVIFSNIDKGTTDLRIECFWQNNCLNSYNKVTESLHKYPTKQFLAFNKQWKYFSQAVAQLSAVTKLLLSSIQTSTTATASFVWASPPTRVTLIKSPNHYLPWWWHPKGGFG